MSGFADRDLEKIASAEKKSVDISNVNGETFFFPRRFIWNFRADRAAAYLYRAPKTIADTDDRIRRLVSDNSETTMIFLPNEQRCEPSTVHIRQRK